jgi:hypothetical protein
MRENKKYKRNEVRKSVRRSDKSDELKSGISRATCHVAVEPRVPAFIR